MSPSHRAVDPALAAMSDAELEAQAQRAAVTHLQACAEAMDEAEEALSAGDEPITEEFLANLPPSPAVAPFDGCDDCVVREVLHAAWPALTELARRAVLAGTGG